MPQGCWLSAFFERVSWLSKEPITAELVNDRLVVWDIEGSRALYKMGYYGKPIGIPKPKGFDFEAPLTLDLIEGLYLSKRGTIRVVKGNKRIGPAALERIARRYHDRFDLKYKVFENLRDKQYIVGPGIKFGCDFAVYEHGPGVDHAPFLIEVRETGDQLTAADLVRAGRLATTVKKRFVFSVVDKKTGSTHYLVSKWWKA